MLSIEAQELPMAVFSSSASLAHRACITVKICQLSKTAGKRVRKATVIGAGPIEDYGGWRYNALARRLSGVDAF